MSRLCFYGLGADYENVGSFTKSSRGTASVG
jgi:hypothetical protein